MLLGPVADDQPLLAPLAALAEQVGLASQDSRPFAYSLFDQDGRKMAALRLYEIWAAREAPDRKPLDMRSLSLDWGFGASAWMGQRLDAGASPCIAPDIRSRLASFGSLAWRAVAPNLTRDTDVAEGLVVACPYFDMVPAAWASHPIVRERLKDSIVLVGATVPWLRDQASAPLLGEVPGVMVHAMALDNLIQSGASATRYPVQYDHLLKLDQSDFVEAVLLLLGFAAVWVMHGAFGYPESEPLPFKVKLAIWGGVAWLGVAIACLSHWPMFKLVTAALAGGVCLQAWDEFLKRWRPETEGETP